MKLFNRIGGMLLMWPAGLFPAGFYNSCIFKPNIAFATKTFPCTEEVFFVANSSIKVVDCTQRAILG